MATGRARVFVGTSGWAYRHWRKGAVYPPGVRQRDELAWLAQRLDSLELNASFYALQRPTSYRAWHDAVPDNFVFAVKGSRFITHNKRLRDVDRPLANFFASGVLALRRKLGPFVWQLPERMSFDAARLAAFLERLPKDTDAAAVLAGQHDARVDEPDTTRIRPPLPIRHALEVRNEAFATRECIDLLRRHDIALVVADSGRWPRFEEVTASFVYVRLHGSPATYASQYTPIALAEWAQRLQTWRRGGQPADSNRVTELGLPSRRARDVFVYFDNDAHGHAPRDAFALRALMRSNRPSRDHQRVMDGL
jgi:uncharacterized protein YecE (DUF72 family)